MDIRIGQIIDRYKIMDVLGEGGMATVYKAQDEHLERFVAIKVIRKDMFPPNVLEKTLKRFEREAKALAKLSHPNIVGVIDYGEFEGAPYLVMEYLTGGTLKEYSNRPMPWQEAGKLLIPIARALQYAHDNRIIHRDIKPSNILLTETRHAMLTDFGVAKLLTTEENQSISITDTGFGLGTPDYMAPEQWNGEAGPQSDIYSLGVVLYELITNQKPYSADTPAEILLKQATQPLPDPKKYIADLPDRVSQFLTRALARDPLHRFKDMNEFAVSLERLIEEKSQPRAQLETLPHSFKADLPKSPKKDVETPVRPIRKGGSGRLFAGAGILVLCVLCMAGSYVAYGNFTATTEPTVTFVDATSTPVIVDATQTPPPTENQPTVESSPTMVVLSQQITDDKGALMNLVPAGTFKMGSLDSGDDTKPVTSLEVADFYMDVYEVTNAMYRDCVDQGGCEHPNRDGSSTRPSYYNNPKFDGYPMIYVNWLMAKSYCEWRDARLPNEAEWEKAARGTKAYTYPWNGPLDCRFANYTGCEKDTVPAVSYDQGVSVYGLYNMAGNVMEWTSTLYRPYPYTPDDGREDPAASGFRVVRGGAWNPFLGSASVRTDTRLKIDQSYSGLYLGFRCAANP